MAEVEFDWDDSNLSHIAEHRVTPTETEEVIRNNPVDLERQNRNGEDRILQLGETNAGRILLVVSTFADGKIRVITAWTAKERLSRYWRKLKSSDAGRDEGKS
jgi:uncharacterized DUF497 family protein